MTPFWDKFHELSRDKSISSRIRFTCMDVIELKKNRWVSRRKEMKAMTLDEIKAEQERELREEERKIQVSVSSLLK